MEIIKKASQVMLLAALAALGCFQNVQAWPQKLIFMVGEDGQTYGFIGDVHATAMVEYVGELKAADREKKEIKEIEKPLSTFLNACSEDEQLFLVEMDPSVQEALPFIVHRLLKKEIGYVPLLARFNILGDKDVPEKTKKLVALLHDYALSPKIPIQRADIRRTKYADIDGLGITTSDFYSKICDSKDVFAKDIQSELDASKYKPEFVEFMQQEAKNVMAGLEEGDKKSDAKPLREFFLYALPEFYWLSQIAKEKRNMMFFLGAAHCDNLKEKLKKVGFKVVYECGECTADKKKLKGPLPTPLSQDDFKKFFALAKSGIKK